MTNDFSGALRGLRPPATFLQPFGLRSGESTIWRIANSRPRFLVNPCAAGWITGLGQFEKRRVKFAIFLSVLSSPHVVLSSLHVVLSSPHVVLSSPHVVLSFPHVVLSSLRVVLSSLRVVLSSLHVVLSSLHVALSSLHVAAPCGSAA